MVVLLRVFRAVVYGRVLGRTMASTSNETRKYLEISHKEYIAYHQIPGKSPGVIFLPGFMSNMNGTKALALERFCRKNGHSYTRFDYRGHGKSSGKHQDCTVGMRKQDVIAILERTEGPQILVGSSLGGWIMLLVAMEMPERIRGLVGVATAADFLWRHYDNLPEEVKKEVKATGKLYIPSSYSNEPYQISLNVIEEARAHTLQDKAIPITCPVRLIHGMKDCEVPHTVSLDLVGQLESKDVCVTLIKEGDHRLSDPGNLKLLTKNVEDLIEHVVQSGHSSL